jgi:hypothetical protein
MAKDDPEGSAVQYKVLVKPNAIGLLVMRRLQRPHIDRSAELRRFIELGYAAEQAGFILDDTVLRHAGRAWPMQPDLGEPSLGDQRMPVGEQLVTVESGNVGAAPRTRKQVVKTNVPSGESGSESRSTEVGTAASSSLRNNLRKLSG